MIFLFIIIFRWSSSSLATLALEIGGTQASSNRTPKEGTLMGGRGGDPHEGTTVGGGVGDTMRKGGRGGSSAAQYSIEYVFWPP